MAGNDSYTKLLLHTDTNFTDASSSAHTATFINTPTIVSPIAGFGTGAGNFAVASKQFMSFPDSADWYFGTGNFTIDFWVKWAAFDAGTPYAFINQVQDTSNSFRIELNSGLIYFFFQLAGVIKGFYYTPFVPVVGTAYHIELCRSGTGAYIFVNGVSKTLTIDTAFGTNDVGDLTGLLYVGGLGDPTPAVYTYWMNGQMQEVRVSKGIARHTANFTPPTAQYDSVTAWTPTTGSLTSWTNTDYTFRDRWYEWVNNTWAEAHAYTWDQMAGYTFTNSTNNSTVWTVSNN